MCDCLLNFLPEYERPYVALLLHSLLALVGFLALRLCLTHSKIVHLKKWWDPSKDGPFEKLRWQEVEVMMTKEPWDGPAGMRIGKFKYWSWSLVMYTGLILIVCGSFALIHTYVDVLSVEDFGEIGAWVGGGSVIIGVFTFLAKTRIETRSRNRQDWIDQLRACLDGLIANMPEAWAFKNGKPIDKSRKFKSLNDAQIYYLDRHSMLELLLNPSEREHRALLSLLRHIYGWEKIGIDDEPVQNLRICKWDPKDKDDWINLKSMIIRLSNSVLKREWEQVKHVR